MVCSVRAFKAALAKKGFALERRTTDELFYLYYRGKKTSVHTKISLGRSEDLREGLLSKIRHQMHFDTAQQFRDFVDCPMSQADYLRLLIEKGVITE